MHDDWIVRRGSSWTDGSGRFRFLICNSGWDVCIYFPRTSSQVLGRRITISRRHRTDPLCLPGGTEVFSTRGGHVFLTTTILRVRVRVRLKRSKPRVEVR